jgi:hypothetical protein
VRRPALPALALLTLLALAPGGCGDSSSKDEKEVRSTVNGLYDSLSERNPKKFCSALTVKQRQILAKGSSRGGRKQSCEQVIGFALTFAGGALKDAKDAKVTQVHVDGDKARAGVEYKKRKGALSLAKENGDWKVSNFSLKKL